MNSLAQLSKLHKLRNVASQPTYYSEFSTLLKTFCFFMTPSCKLVEKQVVFFFIKQKYIHTVESGLECGPLRYVSFERYKICIHYPDIYPKSRQTLLFFIACWPPNVITREVIRCENFVEIIPVFSTFFNFFKKKKKIIKAILCNFSMRLLKYF